MKARLAVAGLPDAGAHGAAVVLVRHGETADNDAGRFQGWTDTPLNERGHTQAAELAATSRPGGGYRHLVGSDLVRAAATADALGRRLGLAQAVDERLRESDRGRWEGLRLSDVQRDEPDAWADWRAAGSGFRFPGGESLAEHQQRARAAVGDILAGPLPAVAVCHGGTIRCLLADDLERFHDLEVPNCSMFGLDQAGRPVGLA
ncbi:MAG: histidine phosphatase family protein [Solirubrobacterales bacterium]